MRGSVIINSGKAHKSRIPMLANLMRRDRIEREFEKSQKYVFEQIRDVATKTEDCSHGPAWSWPLGSMVIGLIVGLVAGLIIHLMN